MKKFFMTLVAVAMAVSVNAQGYFGGSIGVASVKNGGMDAPVPVGSGASFCATGSRTHYLFANSALPK